jgi:hypothetical protein
MTQWTIIQKLFWENLIRRIWLGEGQESPPDRLRQISNLREFITWLGDFVLSDLDKRRPILREIEDLALGVIRRICDFDEKATISAKQLVALLLQPVFTHDLLNELDPVFQRIIVYWIEAEVKPYQIYKVAGPAGEFLERVTQGEIERQACGLLEQILAGQRSDRLRYLLPFHIMILLERSIDASKLGVLDGQQISIRVPQEIPLLFLPLSADPVLRERLFKHFHVLFQRVEPPLADLIGQLFTSLIADDPAASQRSLRRFYGAYLLSTHFQLTRDLARGFEYLEGLPLNELDVLCGELPAWLQGVTFQEIIHALLHERQEPQDEPPKSAGHSTLPILLGPSQLVFLVAHTHEEILQQHPEGDYADVLSQWIDKVNTDVDLLDSLRWLGALLHVGSRFPNLKFPLGEQERGVREWLTEHLLRVLTFKPQESATPKRLVLDQGAQSSAFSPSTSVGEYRWPSEEFLRRSIHAKILRLVFQAVANPVHIKALSEQSTEAQQRDLVGEVLLRGVVLTHRLLPVILNHGRLSLEEVDQRLTERLKISSQSGLHLPDQFIPDLYGPEVNQYDHLLAGTLAVFREVGLGGSASTGSGSAASASVPFWLTRQVRRALSALASRPENDAERKIREAREQGIPNRLQTFLNRTPQEHATELLSFASLDYLREEDILTRGRAALLNLLKQAGEAVNVQMETPIRRSDQPDIIARVKIKGEEKLVLAEVKTSADPRNIRQTFLQLQSHIQRFPTSYGMILVPSISERSRELCEEHGIGYLDLKGNSFVKFAGIFVRTVAQARDDREPSRAKTIFAPVSTRLIRALLGEPSRRWRLTELAEVARVSLGQAYKVKEELLNQEFIEADQKKRLSLRDPSGLLNAWRETYQYENSETLSLFSLEKTAGIEERVKQYCEARNIRYALTLFSGASRLAPFVRHTLVAFYIAGDREELQRELDLKIVDSGANVLLLSPYDEGLFYGLQDVEGYRIVTSVQLYLDLYSYGGRGREQAEFLREKIIGF